VGTGGPRVHEFCMRAEAVCRVCCQHWWRRNTYRLRTEHRSEGTGRLVSGAVLVLQHGLVLVFVFGEQILRILASLIYLL